MGNIIQIHYDSIEKAKVDAFKSCYANSMLVFTNDELSKKFNDSMNTIYEKFSETFNNYVDDILLMNFNQDEVRIPICGVNANNGNFGVSPVVAYVGLVECLLSEEVASKIVSDSMHNLILNGIDFECAKISALQNLYFWKDYLDDFVLDGSVDVMDFPRLIQIMLMRNNEIAVCGRSRPAVDEKYNKVLNYFKDFIPRNTFIETVFNMIDCGELTRKYLDNSGIAAIYYMVVNDCKVSCGILSEEDMCEDDELIRPPAKASVLCFPNTRDAILKLYELSMSGDILEVEDNDWYCPECDDYDDEYPKRMIKEKKNFNLVDNVIYFSFDD